MLSGGGRWDTELHVPAGQVLALTAGISGAGITKSNSGTMDVARVDADSLAIAAGSVRLIGGGAERVGSLSIANAATSALGYATDGDVGLTTLAGHALVGTDSIVRLHAHRRCQSRRRDGYRRFLATGIQLQRGVESRRFRV